MFTLTALKSPAFKLFLNCKLDEKVYCINKLLTKQLSHVPYFFYPRVYRVTMVGEDDAGWGHYA
jgi:hypothetical protein